MTRPVVYDVEPADLANDSPAHLWPEARNPANQWLKNLTGPARLQAQVHEAGQAARRQVQRTALGWRHPALRTYMRGLP